MDRNSLTLLLAQGVSVEQMARRFGKHPSTISYWMQKFGLEAPNRDTHLAKGGIERSRLQELVDAGMTTRQIAAEVQRSQATVRHWLGRYGLKTRKSRGGEDPERRAAARDAGQLVVNSSCERHGETEFILEGRGYYRCKRCRAAGVAGRRRRLKEILVQELGGRCCACGYDSYIGALEFHHLDPTKKRLEISRNGVTLSLAALRAEAAKCVLVCSNCHAELEAGVRTLPATVPAVGFGAARTG